MTTIAIIVLVTVAALFLWDANPRRTVLRVLLLLILLPLMAWALLEQREDPAALVDAWNEWRADFARGHL